MGTHTLKNASKRIKNLETADTLINPATVTTFVPAFSFGGLSVGMSPVAQTSKYRLINDLCDISGSTLISAKGSSTGNFQVALPFTLAADAAFTIGFVNGINIAGTLTMWGAAGNNYATLSACSAGVNTTVNDTHVANSTKLIFSGSFYK
jgi:hypothetical protein